MDNFDGPGVVGGDCGSQANAGWPDKCRANSEGERPCDLVIWRWALFTQIRPFRRPCNSLWTVGTTLRLKTIQRSFQAWLQPTIDVGVDRW